MKRRRPYEVVDLFCGAGGTSTGVSLACEDAGRPLNLSAVNHWERAVETHAANHPRATHYCQDLARLKPSTVVPKGRLDLLVASPECTHHSNARGGKPTNDQSRASAWIVCEWINALRIDRLLIENVPEFVSWGPIGEDGKPLRSKRGHIFYAFIDSIRKSGYAVDWRILNAADYGATTSRRRLFIQAARGRRVIVWPSPTHARCPQPGLFGGLPKWRAAREIIDWSLPGSSIFTRKRPLSPNTMARIEAGLRKFGGKNAEPFLVAMNYLKERGNDNRAVLSLDDPLPTITSQGNRFAFILPQFSGSEPRAVDRPLGCITTTSRGVGLVEPFLADMRGTSDRALELTGRSLDEPHPTITAGGSHTALVEPFTVETNHGGGCERRVGSVEEPLGTVTTRRGTALVEPFCISAGGPRVNAQPVSQPLNTVITRDHMALVDPFVVPYYGTGVPDSVDEPLATVNTRDRFGLVEPAGTAERIAIDIRFRMLQPDELKHAMGFPSWYKITGRRDEQVKQIGNAVEVYQAKALAAAQPEIAA